MSLQFHIAKHLRDVYFGGNSTAVNYKDTLAGVSWQKAVQKVHDFNTIATLVFHTNYYIAAVLKVLDGEELNAKDAYSFDHPPVENEEDWQQMLDKTWNEAHTFAKKIEALPEGIFWEVFSDEKYGNYFRNLTGIIEHLHYHLGQIILIKKLINN